MRQAYIAAFTVQWNQYSLVLQADDRSPELISPFRIIGASALQSAKDIIIGLYRQRHRYTDVRPIIFNTAWLVMVYARIIGPAYRPI
jgi:hypothetical protein